MSRTIVPYRPFTRRKGGTRTVCKKSWRQTRGKSGITGGKCRNSRVRNNSAPTGFAVAEESRDYGRLPVLLARMNPDLAMGDELLKKTGAANLFMVFGEPDIKITTARVSSSGTPISQAREIHTRNSSGRCEPKSTNPRGRAYTPPRAALSTNRRPVRSV